MIDPTPCRTRIPTRAALTVTRLKSELKLRGLKQTGKKADLVRLLACTPGVLLNPSTEVLDQVSTESAEVFSLSPTVKKAAKKKRGSLLPVEVDEVPQLPSATEDLELKKVIMDLLDRREDSFELADDPVGGDLPRGVVYTVYTKKAVRPWDGPHADRAETHVVILLSDVFGWEDPFIRSAADHVADVCDAIVLVPDVFRKRPWVTGRPEEEYEAWRSLHDPVRFLLWRMAFELSGCDLSLWIS